MVITVLTQGTGEATTEPYSCTSCGARFWSRHNCSLPLPWGESLTIMVEGISYDIAVPLAPEFSVDKIEVAEKQTERKKNYRKWRKELRKNF